MSAVVNDGVADRLASDPAKLTFAIPVVRALDQNDRRKRVNLFAIHPAGEATRAALGSPGDQVEVGED